MLLGSMDWKAPGAMKSRARRVVDENIFFANQLNIRRGAISIVTPPTTPFPSVKALLPVRQASVGITLMTSHPVWARLTSPRSKVSGTHREAKGGGGRRGGGTGGNNHL